MRVRKLVRTLGGELDVWIEGVQVVSELLCVGSIKLCVGVVHIPEPPLGGMGGRHNRLLLHILHLGITD